MPRIRDQENYQATLQQVKATARRLMAEHGTAGLSVRGIAKALDLTPPAIYTYFPSLDDLITALITDNFNALADALEAARDAAESDAVARLLAVLMAYRAWALAHPVDFQLIYGNPIPEFSAPREVTVPAVVRGFRVMVEALEHVLQSPEYTPAPPYESVPAFLAKQLDAMRAQDGYAVSAMAMYLGVVGWSQLHGLIVLELFNHLGPVVIDTDAHFRDQTRRMLRAFGVQVSSAPQRVTLTPAQKRMRRAREGGADT